MRLAALALAAALSGCATNMTVVEPTPAPVERSYRIGEVSTVSPGEAIVRVEASLEVPTFTPATPFLAHKAGARGRRIQFTPGQVWTVYSTDDRGNYLLLPPVEANAGSMLLNVRPDGRIERGWLNQNGARPTQVQWSDADRMEPGPPVVAAGSFAAELIYSGRDGDTVSALYQEFADGESRPVYSQGLSFDLSRSNVMSFRSLRIEVDEAASLLTFRVVDDGGLDWVGAR